MPPTEKTADTMTKRQRWAALALLSAGLVMITIDMTILFIALPQLTAELHSTTTEQLWIVDIYPLILAGLLIPMSAVADRIGRRKALLIGFALFGLVSLLVLFATSSAMVIGLRAMLGVAGALIMPTTLSMVRSIFTDPMERTRALAVWSMFAEVGAIIGPLVGGTLLEFFSWHAAFLINVPVAVAVVILGLILLPEARDPNPPRWDFLAVAYSIAGMVAIVWGIKTAAKHNWVDLTAWGVLLAGMLLIALFVVRCLRSSEPLIDVRLFTSKPFTAGIIVALTTSLAMGGIMLLLAQWLQIITGYPPLLAGAALMPMILGSLVSSLLAPEAARYIGARNVVGLALVIAGGGMLLLGAMGNLTSYWQLITPMLMVGVGLGALVIASAIIMGSTPVAKAGNAAALEECTYELGDVLGIAIIGSVAAASYRANLPVGGLGKPLADAAQESLVGALSVARDLSLPDLAAQAVTAFNTGIVQASLAGGVIILLAAVVVFMMVPKDFDIAATEY